MFLKNSFGSVVPELELNDEDYKLIAQVNKELNEYVEHMEKIKFVYFIYLFIFFRRGGYY